MNTENGKKEKIIPKRHIFNRPIVFILGMKIVNCVPVWLAYGIADKVAGISYIVYKKARENIRSNLRKVFRDISEKELSLMTYKTYKNYSKYLIDYGRFENLNRNSMLKVVKHVEGKENLFGVLEEAKGALLLTAHLGNWELGGIFFGQQNIKINILTNNDEIERINEIKDRYRAFHNINTIVVGDSPYASIEVVNALCRNELVAMLIDRYGKKGGVKVDFFGSPTYFPMGPVILSKISKAPLLPAFMVREGTDEYRGIIGKPIKIESGSKKDLEMYVQEIAKVFEKTIRRFPDQWYNFVPIGVNG